MPELANFRGTVLLVEDEPLLSRALHLMLSDLMPLAKLESPLASLNELRKRAQTGEPPSLILSDIQLSDGLSLEALDLFPPQTAVIFITAFNQYVLKVFQFNALDYLLKPISKSALKQSLYKFLLLSPSPGSAIERSKYANLLPEMDPNGQPVIRRFLLKKGKMVIPLPIDQASCIMLEETVVLVYDHQGQHYISDFRSLDEVEGALNKLEWFRVNRRTLVIKSAIKGYETSETGKLLLHINTISDASISVSKEKAVSFKHWLES